MSDEQIQAFFWESMQGVYRTWLHVGKFSTNIVDTTPPTYTTLGAFVSAHGAQAPGWEEIKFRDLLATRSGEGTLRDTLKDWIAQSIPWLVKATSALAIPDSIEERHAIESAGMRILAGGDQPRIVDKLLQIFEADMAELALKDAYLRRRHLVGFASWSQSNVEILEEATEVRPLVEVGATGGRLFLDTSTHETVDPVKAIEWVGGSRDPATGEWRSVAAGMVYRFLRTARRDRASMLLRAADWVSSGDAERAADFVESHGDYESILAKGDIAFVWEWERRHDTPKGEGADLMVAICTKLRSKYPNLTSIVFSVSAQRFMPRTQDEPATIAEARLSDLDKIEHYVRTLGLRLGLEVYVTATNHHDLSLPPLVVRMR